MGTETDAETSEVEESVSSILRRHTPDVMDAQSISLMERVNKIYVRSKKLSDEYSQASSTLVFQINTLWYEYESVLNGCL